MEIRKRINIILAIFILALICFSFATGFWYARKDIRVYRVGNNIELYPKKWPTYNLPGVWFAVIASDLQRKDYEKANQRLETYMRQIRQEAVIRLTVASEREKIYIRKVISKIDQSLVMLIVVSP